MLDCRALFWAANHIIAVGDVNLDVHKDSSNSLSPSIYLSLIPQPRNQGEPSIGIDPPVTALMESQNMKIWSCRPIECYCDVWEREQKSNFWRHYAHVLSH